MKYYPQTCMFKITLISLYKKFLECTFSTAPSLPNMKQKSP